MKKVCVLFVFLFLVGCSKDDDPVIDNPKEEEPQVSKEHYYQLDLELFDGLDITSMEAVASNISVPIDAMGGVTLTAPEEIEEFPVLFVSGEDLLFGFYQQYKQSSEISVDDILLFFFATHPDLAGTGMDKNKILEQIRTLEGRAEMGDLLVENLNSNRNPILDEEFVALLNISVASLRTSGNSEVSQVLKIQEGDPIEEFIFTYERDGTIKLPSESPLFAALVVEVKNTTTGEYAEEGYILEPTGLVLDAASLINWVLQEAMETVAPPSTREIELNNTGDGIYQVYLSNGKGDREADKIVSDYNWRLGVAQALSVAVPLGLKKAFASQQCAESLDAVLIQGGLDKIFQQVSPPYTKEKAIEIASSYGVMAGEVVNGCGLGGNYTKYFKIFSNFYLQALSRTMATAELLFYLRDNYNSVINETETRYFSNKISFGTLRYEPISEDELHGLTKENVFHYSKVIEALTWYEVYREVKPPVSRFEKKTEFKEAEALPFIAMVGEGDAEVLETPMMSDSKGELAFIFELGREVSRAFIQPDFSPYGMIATKFITLKPLDIEGVWMVEKAATCGWGTFEKELVPFPISLAEGKIELLPVVHEGYTYDPNIYVKETALNDYSIEGTTLTIEIDKTAEYECIGWDDDIWFTSRFTGTYTLTYDFEKGEFNGTVSENETGNDCSSGFSCQTAVRLYRQ